MYRVNAINGFTHVLYLTDCFWVDIPLHFQADCVGHFTCQVVLSSCFDIRVYEIEAVVTPQVKDHK